MTQMIFPVSRLSAASNYPLLQCRILDTTRSPSLKNFEDRFYIKRRIEKEEDRYHGNPSEYLPKITAVLFNFYFHLRNTFYTSILSIRLLQEP